MYQLLLQTIHKHASRACYWLKCESIGIWWLQILKHYHHLLSMACSFLASLSLHESTTHTLSKISTSLQQERIASCIQHWRSLLTLDLSRWCTVARLLFSTFCKICDELWTTKRLCRRINAMHHKHWYCRRINLVGGFAACIFLKKISTHHRKRCDEMACIRYLAWRWRLVSEDLSQLAACVATRKQEWRILPPIKPLSHLSSSAIAVTICPSLLRRECIPFIPSHASSTTEGVLHRIYHAKPFLLLYPQVPRNQAHHRTPWGRQSRFIAAKRVNEGKQSAV